MGALPLLDLGVETADTAAMASSFETAPSLDVVQRARSRPLGPVTEIHIDKSDHRLELRAGAALVKSYKVAIGPGGAGPKRWQWDMTTPVGSYRLTGRFKGSFHQFLGVSYPNKEDLQRFAELKAQGVVPPGRTVGDSIGIHGGGSDSDWTAGCIAVQDEEIDEISSLVRDGTRIVITD
jgi:murein L,D-transpeptidase YafK